MSNVTTIKVVQTRYRNTLSTEIGTAKKYLSDEFDFTDHTDVKENWLVKRGKLFLVQHYSMKTMMLLFYHFIKKKIFKEAVDLHYRRLINIQPPSIKVETLRMLLNNADKHLRSLKILKENIGYIVDICRIYNSWKKRCFVFAGPLELITFKPASVKFDT